MATREQLRPAGIRARLRRIAGEFTLTKDGIATTDRPGDMFTVPLGQRHAEQAGPAGAEYLSGRLHPTG